MKIQDLKSFCYGILLVLFISACHGNSTKESEKSALRRPASTGELIAGSRKVLSDLQNPQIFNAETCSNFVSQVTDSLYRLPADYFIPKTPQEVEDLKTSGPEIMDTIFQIRIVLHEKLQNFDKRNLLKSVCTQKIREGFRFARFAEEYLLEWLHMNKIYEYKFAPILTNNKPSTWANPKFATFEIQTGDIMLIRGKSYVSAMIARIGDEEGNFSHLAIVGEDKAGNKHVVEALIQKGVITTPLDKWRQNEDARVALYRNPDAELAKKAGRLVYEKAKIALDRNSPIRYDFAMNDDDYSEWFCSETVRYAYDKASDGKIILPKFRSSVSKFKNTDYPRSLGVTKPTLFAPYDIEVDPRFDLIADYRHYPLLRQVRMQDAVLQSIYGWMIEKDYYFHWNAQHTFKAFLAKFVRQFGVAADTLPKYMPAESIKTNIKFQAVATILEKNIYEKEAEFYKRNGYLPAFQDLMHMNEEYRIEDCKSRIDLVGIPNEANLLNIKKFHSFFYSEENHCQ